MKIKTTLASLLITIVAAIGCGGPATTTTVQNSTPAASPSPANASRPASTATPVEVPRSDRKPSELKPDQPVEAGELRNAVFGAEDEWIGKEVTFTGTYNGHSTSKVSDGEHFSIRVENPKRERVINCDARNKTPPADLKDKREDRVFKGIVKSVNKHWGQVTVEPCEVVK